MNSPYQLTAELQQIRTRIQPANTDLLRQAREHLDQLTKPLGALGVLEDVAAQLFAIRNGDLQTPLRKAVYVIAADHGITEEGVSAYLSEVTRQMVLNFLHGGAAINVLARLNGVTVHVVDVGVAGDLPAHSELIARKVRRGSRNMLREPAMTWDELAEALRIGFFLADDAAKEGVHVLVPGEMGIGNTTAASALTAALTGEECERVTGRGTGVSDVARDHKRRVIRAVLDRHLASITGELDLLRHFGGLEIAAMTGLILGAAAQRIAVVADGFISTAAAAMAVALVPNTRSFLLAGHRSEEPGHTILLERLALTPLLDLRMRLGEGTGSVLAMPLLDAAQRVFAEMATFASAGVSEAAL